jgi:WD40 repeat protein
MPGRKSGDPMTLRSDRTCRLIAVVLVSLAPSVASGTKYDTRPRLARILANSATFVVQNGWNSVAVYRIGDGKLLHKFPANGRVNKFDVTADERFLVVACADGTVAVWDLSAGDRLWRKNSRDTGLEYAYDVSFAWDGKSFIVCNDRDFASIF